MEIYVTATGDDPTRGKLRCGDRLFDCALGRGGIAVDKVEGDGRTPAGRFALRQVLYRADRLTAPPAALPTRPIAESDGWCDAPSDPAYNTMITHPYEASAERLWRDDDLYNIIVVLGHNDDPVVAGAGSAIFLHVAADDFAATEGCVAITQPALLRVIERCTDDTWIQIEAI